MTLSRNLALSATKISADGDIDYNNLLNKPTIPSVAGLASQTYVDTAINNLVDGAPGTLNTLNEIATQLAADETATAAIVTTLAGKASTSDLTTGLAGKASTSDLTTGLAGKASTSDLTTGLAGKQATLVSGTNIKTINGTSVLGSGDITISGGGGGSITGKLITGVGIATSSPNGDLIASLYEPTRTNNGYFGTAVATTDTYIVVGEENKTSQTGVVYIYSATTNALMYTLTSPGSSNARFGCSVAISGNYVVVGSYNATVTNTGSGKIYYYDISTFTAYSGTPITVAAANWTVNNPNYTGTESNDYFGKIVKITNSYVVATATQENSYGGAVYIFNRTNGTLLYTLTDPNPYSTVDSDFFGSGLAIYGNILATGARAEEATDGSGSSGRAYVYDISTFAASPATISTPTLTLNNPSVSKGNDQFGHAIALNGTYVAVSAINDTPVIANPAGGSSPNYQNMGTVYVFNRTTGALVYTLYPNPTGTYIGFGYSMDMNDTQLLVGNYYNGAGDLGAQLFDLSTGTLLKTYLNPSKESSNESDAFGKWVALSNNLAVVSAENDSKSGAGNYLGSVHVFSAKTVFDGTANLTLGLATTSVVPSTYGSVSGSVAYVPQITVDKFGRVTNATTNTLIVSSGLTSAYTTIQDATNPPQSASGSDTIKFLGTGGTTVTVTNVAGVKTVTIDSVEATGGETTGGTFTNSSVMISWNGNYPPTLVIDFSSYTAKTEFLANVGTNVVTVTGVNNPNMPGVSSFTITPAEGSWTAGSGNMVAISFPITTPNINNYGQSLTFSSGITVSYTYGGGGGASPAGLFKYTSTSSSMLDISPPSGATGTQSILLWAVPDWSTNSVNGVNGGPGAISWQPKMGTGSLAPSWSSLYTANNVVGTSTVMFMNSATMGTNTALQWVLDEPIGMYQIYNTNMSLTDNIMGTRTLYLDTATFPNGYMITTRKNIYGSMGGGSQIWSALSGFTAGTGVTAYWDDTSKQLFLKIASTAWTAAVMGSGQIPLGTISANSTGSNIGGTFFGIAS